MNTYWYYAIAAALIIIVLALYAGKLLHQLKKQKQQQKQILLDQKNAQYRHDHKILSSVIIIVRAMKEEQCETTEGCWRLAVLLASLKTSAELDQQFPAIFELYESIKHLSILKARKTLTKQERMKEDFTRMKAEAKLLPQIQQDLNLLHQYTTERISVLTVASS